MTTSVAYLPPVSRSSARKGESLLREQVTEGPPYGRGELDTRWHLIRSAYDVLYEWADDISRVTMYWCGQQRSRRLMTTETIPPGEPTCGTCYGRREGWRRNHGLLFTPHHPFHAWRDLVLARDGVMDVAACLCQTRAVL